MALSKTIIPLTLLLLQVLANKVVCQGDTTSFTFDSFSPGMSGLIFQGDAFVPPSSSFVRLTGVDASGRPRTYRNGRVMYAPVVNFWDTGVQATFETTIKFAISPSGNDVPADGLAFFIAPVNSVIPPGSTGGNLGVFNANGLAPSVFAVEFDIYPNGWDPSYPHIGIDITSRDSRNVSRFENAVGQEVTARINYVSNTRTITVVATYGSRNSTVSYVYDLKTVLPKQVQVGISAATGDLAAFHDLRAWYFTSTLVWDTNNLDQTYIAQYA